MKNPVERTCKWCDREFVVQPSRLRHGVVLYCRPECYHRSRARPLSERFWEKVQKSKGCWEWSGATKGGAWPYGVITGDDGALMVAHRVSWELEHGAVPDGLLVLHSCDNPKCVRPRHLFLGTSADNTLDMVRKGRSRKKLNCAKVRTIRRAYAAGGITHAQLARQFDISKGMVSFIINRIAWTEC
jgi:hypothetical protein